MSLNCKTSLSDLRVGDYLWCKYKATSGVGGLFSDLGTKTDNDITGLEIPTTGTATPDGYFRFIKTHPYGVAIADRVIQTNITWETLRLKGYIEGYNLSNITSQSFYISSGSYGTRNLAFDRVVGVYASYTWESATADGKGWVGQNFGIGNEKKVISYAISACTDYQQNSPIDWNFEASNDGTNWTILHSQTGVTEWQSGQRRYYEIVNDTYYQYYRVNVLNAAGSKYAMISEIEMYETTNQMTVRSLTGGCAYLDVNGNISMINSGNGIYPYSNEFCKYILNNSLNGNIIAGDNSVWNMNVLSWTQNTPKIGILTSSTGSTLSTINTSRIIRGNNTIWGTLGIASSTTIDSNRGFRPVLQYMEPNGSSKQVTSWY
jgi:hypothetical protein